MNPVQIGGGHVEARNGLFVRSFTNVLIEGLAIGVQTPMRQDSHVIDVREDTPRKPVRTPVPAPVTVRSSTPPAGGIEYATFPTRLVIH